MKSLVFALLAEILAIVLVVFIFRSFTEKLWAARWASAVFVTLGVYLVVWFWPRCDRMLTFTWPLALIFLLVFALPMFGFRWLSEASFSEFSWLGLQGPELHEISTKFYYLLFGGTLIDLIRGIWQKFSKK